MLKHLVFPEMLCLCRGTGALRGFSLSDLGSDQPSPSPETALLDPFRASPRFLPKGMAPQGRLPDTSHGTGLGIVPPPAVTAHQWHKGVLVSFDRHRDREMDFIPLPPLPSCRKWWAQSLSFFFGQGGNKQFIEGNAGLAPTWGFLVGNRTRSCCSTLREALHILTFLVACFYTCSSLNFLLRWVRGGVLWSVWW